MRTALLIGSTLLLVGLVIPSGGAHGAPPCNDSGDPGNSDYAQHHIRFLALGGDIGSVDHDGDGLAHTPGSHQGFSLCDPSGA